MTDTHHPATARAMRLVLAALAALMGAGLAATTANAAPGDIPGRGFLPDNRAWEKVSPADKNGSDVLYVASSVRTAPDGERATFRSSSSFGGGAGATTVSDYTADRSVGGWSFNNVTSAMAVDMTNGNPIAFGYQWFSSNLGLGALVRTNGGLSRDVYLRDFTAGTSTRITPTPMAPLDPILGLFSLPMIADATDDGRHILFESREQLTPDAPSPTGVTSLYEWVDGAVRLVSVMPNGEGAPAGVAGLGAGTAGGAGAMERTYRAMSEDGSRIFFTVPTDPFVSVPRDEGGELYLREGGETVHVSASRRTDCADDPTCGGDGEPDLVADPDGPGRIAYMTATPDGSRVFFRTCRRLTDDAPERDCSSGAREALAGNLYRYDVESGDLTSLAGADTAVIGDIGVSDDGDALFFTGTHAGADGVIGYVDGEAVHVGGLDLGLGDFDANSRFSMQQARVSSDGRYALWASSASVEGFDGGGHRMIYLYDTDTGQNMCVSCPSDGSTAAAPAALYDFQPVDYASFKQFDQRVMDEAARWVFFATAQALVPADINGEVDVYQYEVATGEHRLISSGGTGEAHLGAVTPDGRSVFIVTSQRLVSADRDSAMDLYAVRVGGGFPEPELDRPGCVGAACRESGGGGAPLVGPASDGFRGAGDVKQSRRATFSVARPSMSARVRAARTGRLRLAVRVSRPGRISAVARARVGSKRVVVGRRSRRIGSGRVLLSIPLSKSARAVLGQGRGLRVSVAVVVAGAGSRTLSLDLRRSR